MSNTVCLVTGSSRGIGKEIIKEFAKAGCDVVINYYHHEKEAQELKEEIEKEYQVSSLCIKCDVSKEEEVEQMTNTILENYGTIDILVNNAGVCKDTDIFDKSVKDFRRILDVNIIGTYLCSKYIGKIMKEKKRGKIINISSTNALDSYYPASCDYDASKAGVISLTHNFANELAPFVNVNCICPGWVKTDMNKNLSIEQIREEKKKILLDRFASPEEIAKIVKFIASKEASYINDAIIKVDGGRKGQ